MHNFFYKKTIFILISMLIFGIGISLLIVGVQFYFQKNIYEVIAEKYDEGPPPIGDNVSGFAWSENIGWISFNSSDCDTNGNGIFDDSVAGCPDSSVDFYDYGVNIDNFTGNFSGYVWSSNVGWISFKEDGTGIINFYDFNVNCYDTCDSTNNCTACYNYNDNFVYGWAKILSLGNDGWIKFNHSVAVAGNTIINTSANEIEGWAWNGNDNDTGIGWISMNCENEICVNSTTGIATTTDSNGISVNCIDNTCNGEPGVECRNQCKICRDNKDRLCVNAGDCVTGPCDDNVYSVIAKIDMTPTAENLTAPNWGSDKACKTNSIHTDGTGESLRALLKWKYVDSPGDTQSAYRVIVRKNGGGQVINTGKCSSIGGNCRINSDCINCYFPLYETDTNFDYNTSYEWSVEVWDTNGNNSSVISYDVIFDTDNDDGVNTTFTTYKHKFPEPNFTWFSNNPSINEEVMFMASSTSVCYESFDPDTNIHCGDSSIWDWSRISGSDISADSPNPNNASTTIIKFIQSGQEIGIQLNLTDSDGYSCSTSTINDKTKQNLPSWIETK